MAAGERCCAVGVVRFVLGDVFEKNEVVVEAHHGIEDDDGNVEYTRLDEHRIGWEKAKEFFSASEWKVLLKLISACERDMMTHHKAAKGKKVKKFDESHKAGRPVPFSPL